MFSDLEKHILIKLFRHGYIGRRHTAREELKQRLPSNLRDMKIINNVCDNLIEKGYLIPQHGKRVSINPEKNKEIESLMMERF